MVQHKILTADKLLARNWPCDPICQLCDQELESAEHLCLQCVYAQEVWLLVTQWTDDLVCIPGRHIFFFFEGTGGAEAPTENQLIIKQGKSNKNTRV
jgi:hypothetical protein